MMNPDFLERVATLQSAVGAMLVSAKSPRLRVFGFFLWVVANIYWVIFAIIKGHHYMCALSVFYTITSLVGIYNNWKTDK